MVSVDILSRLTAGLSSATCENPACVTPATATSGGCAVATPGCQPCVAYQGCTPGYPMIWCPTKGSTPVHSNQVPLTTVGLWKFVTQF